MSLKYDSAKKLRKEKKKFRIDSWQEYEEREEKFLKERLHYKEPTIYTSVRITGGKAKNFKIDVPPKTRPLTDRMKVTIFNLLKEDISNKTVLDLYAGSGSFGLEALSRGAKEATFVDASRQADIILRRNIAHTGFLPEAEVVKSKVEDFLLKTKQSDKTYDIIFFDPPYKLYNTKKIKKMELTINETSKLLPGIKESNKKQFKGAIIIKHPRRYPIDTLQLEYIKRVESYNFGLNSISFYIVK